MPSIDHPLHEWKPLLSQRVTGAAHGVWRGLWGLFGLIVEYMSCSKSTWMVHPPLPISGRYFMPLSRSGLQCVHCAPTDKDLPATCVCIYPLCCVSTISFHYHDISFVLFKVLPEHGFEYIYIISSTSLHYHEICFVRFNRQGFATKRCLHISIGLKHITSSSWDFFARFNLEGFASISRYGNV